MLYENKSVQYWRSKDYFCGRVLLRNGFFLKDCIKKDAFCRRNSLMEIGDEKYSS